MFEQIRQSLNELLERATKPEDRRDIVARMKGTLVQARMGLDELRDALKLTQRKLDAERRELETVRRRKELALKVQDAETVTVAERFEKTHDERVRLLEEKLTVQTREVELAEREVESMKADIRAAMIGGPPPPAGSPLDDPENDPTGEASANKTREEIDALARARARADRSADADRMLEELKRKMGK